MFKKIIYSLFLSSLFLIISTNANAEELVNSTSSTIFYTDEELEEILNQDEYTVALTPEQAIRRVAELKGDPLTKVLVSKDDFQSLSNLCHRVETRKPYTTKKGHTLSLIVTLTACRNGTFQFLEPSAGVFFAGIAGNGKAYSGAFQVEVTNSGYYYQLLGNLYNHSSMTHAGTTGLNAIWTTTYTVSTTSNHYEEVDSGYRFMGILN